MKWGALMLFQALVEKGQGFTEALAAAEKGITDQNEYVRNSALVLLKALVEKGQGFPEAIVVATEGITDQDYGVRNFALDLFKALVQKDPDETKEVIQKLVNDPDVNLPNSEKEQLKILFAQ